MSRASAENGKKGGRPVGSKEKLLIRDFLKPKDVQKLLNKAYAKAMKGDAKMLQFLLEQSFGKAPQNLNVGSQEGNPLIIQISKEVAQKNHVSPPSTSGNS